jgi:hypothetical protein
MTQRVNPADFVTPTQRKRIEAAIERLLALLDQIDGDIDLEDDEREPEPLEPYLADAGSDLEFDPCDL